MPKILIAGCGFIGLAAAELFHRAAWHVIGLTHSPPSASALSDKPFRVLAADVADLSKMQQLASTIDQCDAVLHCASSGRGDAEAYRHVYLAGAQNLQKAFPQAQLTFTSSTSVYAQTDGGEVTETSSAEPERETGRILRETEECVLAPGGIVARLSGIYGPGRSVLLKKFFSGEARIEEDGSRWINQIHRDDAARALLHLITQRAAGIFNVTDDTPLSQRAVYESLAARFEMPLPPAGPIDPNRKRGWTHKRVSNAKLRSTGWAPRFPSFFAAIETDPALLHALGR